MSSRSAWLGRLASFFLTLTLVVPVTVRADQTIVWSPPPTNQNPIPAEIAATYPDFERAAEPLIARTNDNPDMFAGAYVGQAGDRWGLTIYYSGSSDDADVLLGPVPEHVLVRLVPAQYSTTDLNAVRDAIFQSGDQDRLALTSVGINVTRNQLEVWTTGDLEAVGNELANGFGDRVFVRAGQIDPHHHACDSRAHCWDLRGGTHIYMFPGPNGENECTWGHTMRDSDTNLYYITTAAHCGPRDKTWVHNGSGIGTEVYHALDWIGFPPDAQIIRVSSGMVDFLTVQRNKTFYNLNILGMRTRANFAIGQEVRASGWTGGCCGQTSSGYITGLDLYYNIDGVWYNGFGHDAATQSGMSGGPIYAPASMWLLGTISGGMGYSAYAHSIRDLIRDGYGLGVSANWCITSNC